MLQRLSKVEATMPWLVAEGFKRGDFGLCLCYAMEGSRGI